VRLASKTAFARGRFAAIVASVLAAWTFACESKSTLMTKRTGDAGVVDAAASVQSSGGSLGVAGLGGAAGALGTGGAVPFDAGAAGGLATDASLVDGALDAPAVDAPVADATGDSTQACGDAVCRSNQTCAQIGGGPAPPCDLPLDGGTCAAHLVLVASCGNYGSPSRQPGCTTPPDTPQCYDTPDGCDFCSCVCGAGAGCYPGPGYLVCGRP